MRLHTDLPFRDHATLSLQFWVRGVSSHFDGQRCRAPDAAARGWTCHAPVCLALWRSWAGREAVQMVPLCAFAQAVRSN